MKNSFKSFLVLIIICLAATAPGASLASPQAPFPQIDSLSASALGRAGRLRIFGANFGATKAGGQVLIDGVPAPVSRWSDTLVVAYVPESARIATVPVQVVTSGGSSNLLLLDVKANDRLLDATAPQANGSIKWQFEVDGDYMEFRPTIGPDGTIYFQDVNGHLYALRPDGSVKWIFQGGYPAGPVAVGADNTTYIASGSTIQAISPAGTLVWQFTDPNSQGVFAGPAVGPDGKIYAVMDLLGLGAIALSPVDGHLVWSNQGNPQVSEYGQLGVELFFGPASPGAQPDQFYFTCDDYTTAPQGHLYAFSLNGDQRWAVTAGGTSQTQIAVLPNGTLSGGVAAYNPANGAAVWSAYSALGSGSDLPTDIGIDGRVYVAPLYQGALAALNGQTGAVLWRVTGVGNRVGPVVSPLNDVVIAGGQDNYGLPGFFKAFSTSGQFLWQIDLPGAAYPGPFEYPFAQGRFSPDGTTVYMGTTISGEPADNIHCNLYALQTANAPTCADSINPLNNSFTSSGGQSSANVTAPNGCGWTATSNVGWIATTSSASGTGNGTVNYAVAANTGAARSGTMTIAGQTFTVNQAAGCTVSLDHPNMSFTAAGGTDHVAITASDANCNWTATSNDTFITITSGSSGSGNGTVNYSVAANQSGSPRSGTITIAGQTFTVNQSGIGCSFTLGSNSASFGSTGGTGGGSVSTTTGCNWTATSNADWITITAGASGSGNGTVTYSVLANTGPARSGTMTIAGPLFTVNQAAGHTKAFNFDGDGKADVAVFRPSTGAWYIQQSSNGLTTVEVWGTSGDVPVAADYDGDGKTDVAVWRPSNGTWYVHKSSDGALLLIGWGVSTDKPVPADFDGDGKADVAVWRPSNGTWYIRQSSNSALIVVGWGTSGDVPMAGYFDSDGKADVAVFRPSTGTWYINNSANGSTAVVVWGTSGDVPVAADYDSDGKTDVAVWRPSNGSWYVQKSSNGALLLAGWGVSTDKPVPADFDGDGKADVAVWRPANGTWYIQKSFDGSSKVVGLGTNGDMPISDIP